MKDDRFDKMDEKLESKSWDFRELEDGEEQRERLRQKRNVSNERRRKLRTGKNLW